MVIIDESIQLTVVASVLVVTTWRVERGRIVRWVYSDVLEGKCHVLPVELADHKFDGVYDLIVLRRRRLELVEVLARSIVDCAEVTPARWLEYKGEVTVETFIARSCVGFDVVDARVQLGHFQSASFG